MVFDVSESLVSMGWGDDVALRCSPVFTDRTLVPARVVRQERGVLHALSADGAVLARPSGRLLHEVEDPAALPVIGDWVLLSQTAPAIIHAVVARKTLLARRAVGGAAEVQPIAANVDRALVVQPIDDAPNVRRIERTLALARSAGVLPIVVLTKADLSADAAAATRAVEAVAFDAPVVTLGLDSGLDGLLAHLPVAQTAVVLGPSGAGKSTLANRLVGEERLAVGAVRERDAKGRHTTTHRELIVLPHGALLIDGPGMRELGLWSDDGGVDATFEEVHALAASCRFRDCRHAGEPGCAVREALANGGLTPERLASFDKLARESAYEARRTDAALRQKHERAVRSLSRAGREISRAKRG